MPPRPHDPFNDAPRRPTARAGSHHLLLPDTYQSGGHALRANTAARNLFAPAPAPALSLALARRPTATATATATAAAAASNVELVLEDSGDDGDRLGRRSAAARGGRVRRTRAATFEPDDGGAGEPARELVVRDERGAYLHEVPAVGGDGGGVGGEDDHSEADRELSALVAEYWAAGGGGGGAGGRGSKRWDEHELEKPRGEVMGRLREAVSKKLTDEQWMYEPTDYMEELRVANHGRV